jgi:hypothetical protein
VFGEVKEMAWHIVANPLYSFKSLILRVVGVTHFLTN